MLEESQLSSSPLSLSDQPRLLSEMLASPISRRSRPAARVCAPTETKAEVKGALGPIWSEPPCGGAGGGGGVCVCLVSVCADGFLTGTTRIKC